MRTFVLAALAAALASHAAAPATASPVDVLLGRGDCAVTGTARYAPPVSAVPHASAYDVDLALDCATGGDWTLALDGASTGATETCGYGVGSGTLAAARPKLTGAGGFQATRHANYVAIGGWFDAGGHQYQVNVELLLTTGSPADCATGLATASATGTGYVGVIG